MSSSRLLGISAELDSSGDGCPVCPFPGHGVGEHVDAGLVIFDGYVSVVGVASSGHGCVDTL